MVVLTKKREWKHSQIYKEKTLRLNFGLKIPEAILWPDQFGDGYENDAFESLKNGYGCLFFYFEDYINYTEIVDGIYIISGYENQINIGDWLVEITVFGSLGEIKAIACKYIESVKIISEVRTIGPTGLDMIKCIYKIINSHNTYYKKLK